MSNTIEQASLSDGRQYACLRSSQLERLGYTLARLKSVWKHFANAIIMAQVVTMNAKDILTWARLRSIHLPSTWPRLIASQACRETGPSPGTIPVTLRSIFASPFLTPTTYYVAY